MLKVIAANAVWCINLNPSVGWNYLSIPKFQRLPRLSLGMDKQFHPTLYDWCDYISRQGLKLIHVSKKGLNVAHGVIKCWFISNQIEKPLRLLSNRHRCLRLCYLGRVRPCALYKLINQTPWTQGIRCDDLHKHYKLSLINGLVVSSSERLSDGSHEMITRGLSAYAASLLFSKIGVQTS